MRLPELGELIAVNLSGDPWFDADIRFPDPRDLLDIFPGLLQVEVDKFDNCIVRLAHFSVKEYLISERIKTQKPQKFWLSEVQSHEIIAATCLAYILHFEDKDDLSMYVSTFSRKSRERYPLMNYACWGWTVHAVLADSHQGILKGLSLEFLRRSDLRRVWFGECHSGLRLVTTEMLNSLPPIPPLFIAAHIGLLGILEALLASGHDINERCALGTALETAATWGHHTVLIILLENSADPNLLGRDNCPPLHVAARFMTLKSVEALIESGAEIHDERGSFGSSLIAACVSGRHGSVGGELVEFLLERGVNIHLSSKEYGNALHAACAQPRANIALIEKLVSRGISVDARGGKYGTPLQAACAHSSNEPVIRFLLSRADPCIGVKESKYGTALQAICAESHDNDKVVELLLNHGAKKTARGGKYGTVLHAACYQRNEKIARLLLRGERLANKSTADQPLDINEVTAQYGTPLHAACLGGSEEVVRLLAEMGADIDANVPQLGTPLHLVCNGKSTTNAELLLANGADVNIRRDRQPFTALEILLQERYPLESWKILGMLYEKAAVVETGLSRRDALRLEELKKSMGIPTDGGIIDRGSNTAAELGSPGTTEQE